VRSDVVSSSTECSTVPSAEVPEAPVVDSTPQTGDSTVVTIEDLCPGGNIIFVALPDGTIIQQLDLPPNSSIQIQLDPGFYEFISADPRYPSDPACRRSSGVQQVPGFNYWVNCPPSHYCNY
jgi:hypothetical protein